MDFNIPELVNLSLKAIAALLFILGFADTVIAWALSLSRGEFSGIYAGHWLTSHVPIWFSIFLLAVLGKGVVAFEIPAIGAFADAALIGLGSYAVVVLNSLRLSATETTAPPSVPSP